MHLDSGMDADRWHVVRVVPGSELSFSDILGDACYVPTVRVRRFNRRYRKMIETLVAVIPGYVFLLVQSRFHVRIPPVPNFRGFMRNADGTDAVLSCREYEQLLDVERNFLNLANEKAKPLHKFEVGQSVRCKSGAFAGLSAIVERLNDLDPDHVGVHVSLFGRDTKAVLPTRDLETAA